MELESPIGASGFIVGSIKKRATFREYCVVSRPSAVRNSKVPNQARGAFPVAFFASSEPVTI
jgi:hypothetical protein